MLCMHSFRLALIEGIGVLNRRTAFKNPNLVPHVVAVRGEVNSARIWRGIK